MAGRKETSTTYRSRIVLKKEGSTIEKGATRLLSQYNHHNNDHPCPVCGSTEESNNGAGNNNKMSPVQVDLFKNLIVALTLEASFGSSSSGGDNSTLDQGEEDVQNFTCEECLGKFDMLESLQNEISLLEDKVEEILSQLRKTIRDRRGLISHPPVHKTEPVGLDNATHSQSTLNGMDMEEEENDGEEEVDLKPVILEFQDQFPSEDEDDGIPDDPLGGVDAISEEQSMNNLVRDEPTPIKSIRGCKVRATKVIAAILENDDNGDDDSNDEYSPNHESDTDSDDTNEVDTRIKRYEQIRPVIPPGPSSSKKDDKHISTMCRKQVVQITDHMQTNRSDRETFPSETSNKTLPTHKDATANRKIKHRYKCEKCGKGFSTLRNLKRHLNTRIPCTELLKNKKFICPICKAGFSSSNSIRYHTRKAHTLEKTIKCPHTTCKKTFIAHTTLQRHLELCHKIPQDETNCTICNEKFSTLLQKLAHFRTCHTCKFCNKQFPNKADLDEHKTTHTGGDHPFVCTKCGARFGREEHFRTHLRTICNPDKDEMERIRKTKRKYDNQFLARKKAAKYKCEFCLNTYVLQERLFLHISKCHEDVNNK